MSAQNNNLDLTDIPSDDLDRLAATINTFYKQDAPVKAQLAYHWERNQLMLDGYQWIVYEGDSATNGLWKKLKVTQANEYIPRPVTNYLFDVYQTLKSYLIKDKPRSKVYPNSQENQDKIASQIGTLCLEGNWARLQEDYNYESAAAALVTYGTVFKKDYWDTTASNLVTVPKMIPVPITDPNTGEVIGQTEQQDFDPVTKEPLTEQLPIGDVATTILEPFRITLDPLAMHLHEARWILETSIVSLDYVREMFDKEEEGYTGLADLVQEEADLNMSMLRWFQMRNTSGVKEMGGNKMLSRAGATDVMFDNCVVLKEYYERPSAPYPQGRMIVVAHDQTVYSGPSPYSFDANEQGDWHPYSECRWEIVPGRFWGKSPLDPVIELQKRVNSIDSALILTRKTSAVPQKLIPMNAGVSPGSWTGRPNQEIFYRPDAGAKPETIPSSGVDPQVFNERQLVVNDIEEISGATDILKGGKPPGVDSAAGLNLLYEVGTGKIFPVLNRWKMFVESSQKKQLKLIGKYYKEPRPDFIRMLKQRNKDLNEYDINEFIGMDLFDNFNVVVEAGSNIPKLQAAKQALLLEMAQMGTLNLQDPSNRSQFLKDMGLMGYDTDIEPDKKRAEWENDLIDNLTKSPDTKPVVLAVDNHQVHIQIHSNRMKSPAFMSLPFPIQQAYMQHIQQHEQFQAQAMQAQMYQQQAMGPKAPPVPGTQQQAAGVQAGHGHGLRKDTKNAIIGGTDVLNPATLGTG